MKKFFRVISFLLISVLLTMCLLSCAEQKEFEELASGDKVDISQDTVNISASFDPAKAKDGYIPSAGVYIDVKGYKVLSYFGASIVFTWDYEYLGEDGQYISAKEIHNINLDATGCGNYSGTVEFSNYRAIRNIVLSAEYSGYAVKK